MREGRWQVAVIGAGDENPSISISAGNLKQLRPADVCREEEEVWVEPQQQLLQTLTSALLPTDGSC